MLGVFGIGNATKAEKKVIGYATRGPNGHHAVYWCDQRYYSYTSQGTWVHRSPSLTAKEAAEDSKKFYGGDVQIYEIME
jgi:hypothetical protein